MNLLRSILYVPAHKDEWVANVGSNGADAVILDLEDSVPTGEKDAARAAVSEHSDALAAAETTVTVRVNEVGSDAFHEDIEVLGSWTDAVVVPKAEAAAEIRSLGSVLEYVEYRADIPERIEIVPLLESPEGICAVGEITSAGDRIAAVGSSTSRGGDIQQSLGLGWSSGGDETLHVRSKIVLEARAAGVEQILSGIWATVDDEEGLREKATRQKRFGFTGMQVIHPGQVDVVNDVFTPSAEELDYYRELVETFEREQGGEQGAIRFNGEMVDAAKVKYARRMLDRAADVRSEST